MVEKSDPNVGRSSRSSRLISTTPIIHHHTGNGRFGNLNHYSDVTGLAKLDFLRFNSDKIKEWMFQIEQFFLIDHTPEELKVSIAAIHFDEFAATWHQSIVQSVLWKHVMHDWLTYKLLLQGKFNDLVNDTIAELKQLQEIDEIDEYHARFELISTRVNLSEDSLVSAYLTGLRLDTQMNVRMFQPHSIKQCLMLGRLYEHAHPKKFLSKEDDDREVTNECQTENQNVEIMPQIFVNVVVGMAKVSVADGKCDLSTSIAKMETVDSIPEADLNCEIQPLETEMINEEDFEKPFLKASAQFYKVELQDFSECCDSGDYLKKAEKPLIEEVERVTHYVDVKSEEKITSVVKSEVIANHMHRLVHMEKELIHAKVLVIETGSFCTEESCYVLEDLTSAILEKNRSQLYCGFDFDSLQFSDVFKICKGVGSCEKPTVLNINLVDCQMFEIMHHREHNLQHHRKKGKVPKSWKFKFKAEKRT